MDADDEFKKAVIGNQVPQGSLIEYVQRKEPRVQIYHHKKTDKKSLRYEKVVDSTKERQHAFSVAFYHELSLKLCRRGSRSNSVLLSRKRYCKVICHGFNSEITSQDMLSAIRIIPQNCLLISAHPTSLPSFSLLLLVYL